MCYAARPSFSSTGGFFHAVSMSVLVITDMYGKSYVGNLPALVITDGCVKPCAVTCFALVITDGCVKPYVRVGFAGPTLCLLTNLDRSTTGAIESSLLCRTCPTTRRAASHASSRRGTAMLARRG